MKAMTVVCDAHQPSSERGRAPRMDYAAIRLWSRDHAGIKKIANRTCSAPATRQTAVAMPDASQSSSQKVTAAGRISNNASWRVTSFVAAIVWQGGLRHGRRSLRTISRPRSGIQVAHVLRMSSASPRPIPGDFLLHRVSHWTGVLLVGLDRDQPELSCQTYSAALAHAQRGAVRSNVDVWQTTDGTLFERLASYRLS